MINVFDFFDYFSCYKFSCPSFCCCCWNSFKDWWRRAPCRVVKKRPPPWPPSSYDYKSVRPSRDSCPPTSAVRVRLLARWVSHIVIDISRPATFIPSVMIKIVYLEMSRIISQRRDWPPVQQRVDSCYSCQTSRRPDHAMTYSRPAN